MFPNFETTSSQSSPIHEAPASTKLWATHQWQGHPGPRLAIMVNPPMTQAVAILHQCQALPAPTTQPSKVMPQILEAKTRTRTMTPS